MPASVHATCGLAAISFVLAVPAAAEEKSTKPRIAVIEFTGAAESSLEVKTVSWGGPMEFGVEREMKESGEKGGTEDINIGVGELQEVTISKSVDASGPQASKPPPMTWDNVKQKAVTGSAREHDKRTVWVERTAPAQGGAGARETITIGSNRTESGLPTGKRQHKPFAMARPLDKGSVMLRLAQPWAGCKVGARYPSLALSVEGRRYLLHDAAVASCGGNADDRPTEEVAFYYNRIK